MSLPEVQCACGCGTTIFPAGKDKSEFLYAELVAYYPPDNPSNYKLFFLNHAPLEVVDPDGTAHGYTDADDALHGD